MIDGKQNTLMAVLAYVFFLIPLLTGDAKKDEYVKFHTKQGLALFIVAFVLNIIRWVMPYQIWWSFGWIFWLLGLGTFVLFIVGVINALNGKKDPLPVIGSIGDKFNF